MIVKEDTKAKNSWVTGLGAESFQRVADCPLVVEEAAVGCFLPVAHLLVREQAVDLTAASAFDFAYTSFRSNNIPSRTKVVRFHRPYTHHLKNFRHWYPRMNYIHMRRLPRSNWECVYTSPRGYTNSAAGYTLRLRSHLLKRCRRSCLVHTRRHH